MRTSITVAIVAMVRRGTREKKIIEQFSQPRFFTEFENRGLFFAATQQGRKGRDFQTP